MAPAARPAARPAVVRAAEKAAIRAGLCPMGAYCTRRCSADADAGPPPRPDGARVQRGHRGTPSSVAELREARAESRGGGVAAVAVARRRRRQRARERERRWPLTTHNTHSTHARPDHTRTPTNRDIRDTARCRWRVVQAQTFCFAAPHLGGAGGGGGKQVPGSLNSQHHNDIFFRAEQNEKISLLTRPCGVQQQFRYDLTISPFLTGLGLR